MTASEPTADAAPATEPEEPPHVDRYDLAVDWLINSRHVEEHVRVHFFHICENIDKDCGCDVDPLN